MDKYEEAMFELKKASSIHSENPKILYELAESYCKVYMTNKALETYILAYKLTLKALRS